MTDRTTRLLAASALGVALVALVLAGYAVSLGQSYRDDVRTLGEAIRAAMKVRNGQPSAVEVPLRGPPPQIEANDD